MNRAYRDYYLKRPPTPLLKAKLDNIAIVPASMLPFKDKWQEMANTLPQGSVLLYHFSTSDTQIRLLTKVENFFKQKGHAVKNIAVTFKTAP